MTAAPLTERIEKDPLGPVSIPADAYYGPQTARGIANFPISGIQINHFPNFIKSLAYVKMATARANAKLGDLEAAFMADHLAWHATRLLGEPANHVDQ